MRSRRLLLAAILMVCVFGRGAWALHLVHTKPDATTESDTHTYLYPAQQINDHGKFTSVYDPKRPEFVRTPGYPVFVAAIYRLFGEHNTAVILAQVLLSAFTAFLAYLLAARIWSVPIGLLAAALTVLEPLQNYTSATLITECLGAFLLMAAAAVGFVAFRREELKAGLWALLGLILACAVLERPVTYYFPVVVFVLLLIRRARRHDSWRALTKVTAAFLVPLVLLVGGWQLRNHQRVDSWRVSGIEGKNMYQFRAAGVLAEATGASFDKTQQKLIDEFGPPDDHVQGPYYNRMEKAGLKIVKAHPLDAVKVTLTGLWTEVFSVRLKFFEYLGLKPQTGGVVVVAEILLLAFYALCAYGMALVVRRRRDLLAHVFVAAIAFYIILASAGPEARGGRGERFRSPILPILVLYAAFGGYTLFTQLRTRRGDRAPGELSRYPAQ
jgi:4-amino-4-deoxy-L-arabinose transferase-like glycosyltransferase